MSAPSFERPHMPPHLLAFTAFFEHITPASLPQLHTVYADQARFKDPFNDVVGTPAIASIFEHMFDTLQAPRFEVRTHVSHAHDAFVTWDFTFHFRRFSPHTLQTIHGATHLVFNEQGLVTLHRDYWDAAEELYEKLPAVGSLMRWLKRRANS